MNSGALFPRNKTADIKTQDLENLPKRQSLLAPSHFLSHLSKEFHTEKISAWSQKPVAFKFIHSYDPNKNTRVIKPPKLKFKKEIKVSIVQKLCHHCYDKCHIHIIV